MSKSVVLSRGYTELVNTVGVLLDEARKKVYTEINFVLVKTYWEIGRQIVEFEQKGKEKAEYGSALLDKLSVDLKLRYGKGFSKSNIVYMRLFYIKYQKSETLSHQLSWSHYFELLKIEDDLERLFYEKQCLRKNWSVRELKRQKSSAFYERLALNKGKERALKLSKEGYVVEKPEDIVKDPFVFELWVTVSDEKVSHCLTNYNYCN